MLLFHVLQLWLTDSLNVIFPLTFLCLSFLSGSFGATSSYCLQSQTGYYSGGSGTHTYKEAQPRSIRKLMSFYFATRVLANCTNYKMKLTRNQIIPWKKVFGMCAVNKYFMAVPCWQLLTELIYYGRVENFLAITTGMGVRTRENGNARGPDWNPTNWS